MSQATTAQIDAIGDADRSALKSRVASILGTTVFVGLLCLIVLTAIPYGATQAWWKAAFVSIVFVLAILWLLEGAITQSWFERNWSLVLPIAGMALLAFLQTLPLGGQSSNPAGINFSPWNAISADPYQTRFFMLLILALMLSGVMLARYASSEKRLRIVINLVILLAVASALFGILRQTTQRDVGFGLPLLPPDVGYGQFINRNHFAYLMEMSLGLILGLILGGGVKREQSLMYFAALLPIWIGLVFCNSRGGLIAMLGQVVIAALLFNAVLQRGQSRGSQSKVLRLSQSWPVRIVLILVLVAGVVFGTVWLGGDRLATKIEDRTELSGDPEGLRLGASRNEIWKATWRMFMAHPILGVGLGGYWAAIPAYHDASGTMTPQEAHNDYLELLASGGFVGLTLGVWFAVIVVKRTRENMAARNRFRRAACLGATIGIAGVAVHSLVDFGLHAVVNALVFTTLIVIATPSRNGEASP
jgi:putative inorganic carbon (HCO3(-)) transporter